MTKGKTAAQWGQIVPSQRFGCLQARPKNGFSSSRKQWSLL